MKRLCETFPSSKNVIRKVVLSRHQIELEDLPSWDDGRECFVYKAALSRDYMTSGAGDVHTPESLMLEQKPEATIIDDLASASDNIPPATSSPVVASEHEERLVCVHKLSRYYDQYQDCYREKSHKKR